MQLCNFFMHANIEMRLENLLLLLSLESQHGYTFWCITHTRREMEHPQYSQYAAAAAPDPHICGESKWQQQYLWLRKYGWKNRSNVNINVWIFFWYELHYSSPQKILLLSVLLLLLLLSLYNNFPRYSSLISCLETKKRFLLWMSMQNAWRK